VVNPANRLAFDVQGRLDTGCNVTSITRRLARTLALMPTRYDDAQTSAGEIQTSLYWASIILPHEIMFPNIEVVEFVEKKKDSLKRMKPEDDFDVLIGMDIITSGDLAITNDAGNTVVSFRKPHGPYIDFSR
jgi:hypothetical protein